VLCAFFFLARHYNNKNIITQRWRWRQTTETRTIVPSAPRCRRHHQSEEPVYGAKRETCTRLHGWVSSYRGGGKFFIYFTFLPEIDHYSSQILRITYTHSTHYTYTVFRKIFTPDFVCYLFYIYFSSRNTQNIIRVYYYKLFILKIILI